MAGKGKITGTVRQIEDGIVVVLVRDPDNPKKTSEIDIPLDRFNKVDLKPGDKVTIITKAE